MEGNGREAEEMDVVTIGCFLLLSSTALLTPLPFSGNLEGFCSIL